MKRIQLLLALSVWLCTIPLNVQSQQPVNFPDISGYQTLTLDPHLHTVFSDGFVWPNIRVLEANREGIDAISLSEHVEYRPFQRDVVSDHNRSYSIAGPAADALGVLLIRGNEITRDMPPGHFNALFHEDSNELAKREWRDAFRAARDQGAFLIWNHPGWNNQQSGPAQWHDIHTWLVENDLMHAIEVANGLLPNSYSPEAHQWCLDYNLTMIGSSDAHNPMSMDIDFAAGERRTMTLVFAEERSVPAMKDALMNRRTVVYFDDTLAGREEYLMALFEESFEIESVTGHRHSYSAVLRNHLNMPVTLTGKPGSNEGIEFFHKLTVPPGDAVEIYISSVNQPEIEEIVLELIVENFLSMPGRGMPVELVFRPD